MKVRRPTALEDDLELKLITARKLAELKRKAEIANAPKQQKTSKDLVLERLYDRGDEVLETAYQYFPRETQTVVDQLARIFKETGTNERISGGELYSLFRSLGLRISLKTSIKVEDKGKFVDLAEKLKMGSEKQDE
jgi:Cdc6-like AAA superfamily ATPase